MRFTAAGLTLLLAIVLLSAVVLLVVGEIVLNQVTYQLSDLSHVRLDGYSLYGLFALRFLVIFIVFFLPFPSSTILDRPSTITGGSFPSVLSWQRWDAWRCHTASPSTSRISEVTTRCTDQSVYSSR